MAIRTQRSLSNSGPAGLVPERFRSMPRRFRAGVADGLRAEWELRVGDRTYSVRVSEGACAVVEGATIRPDTVISVAPDVWLAIDEGSLTGAHAFLDHRLEVSGNLDLAVRLQTLFRPYGRSRRSNDLEQLDVQTDGLTLSCYVIGKGEPAVLLHGLGASKISWFPLLEALAERYRVIVPDLPGHGESAKPKTDYSPRFYARAVRLLMDAVDADRAVVMGNSLGGRVALELALRSPARVSRLVLLSPAVPGFRWRYVAGFTRVFPTEIGAIPFPLRERLMATVLERLFAHPGQVDRDAFMVAAKEFLRIYRDPAARMAFFSSLRHVVTERPEPFLAVMRRIRQPVLLIFGEQDRLVPPRLSVRLSHHLPNVELLGIPGVGHVPQFEATDRTLEAIRRFLPGWPEERRRSEGG